MCIRRCANWTSPSQNQLTRTVNVNIDHWGRQGAPYRTLRHDHIQRPVPKYNHNTRDNVTNLNLNTHTRLIVTERRRSERTGHVRALRRSTAHWLRQTLPTTVVVASNSPSRPATPRLQPPLDVPSYPPASHTYPSSSSEISENALR